jgi:hypothetical protein
MKVFKVSLLRDKGKLDEFDPLGTEMLVFAIAKNHRVTVVPIIDRRNADNPRFAKTLKANILIAFTLANGVRALLAVRLR